MLDILARVCMAGMMVQSTRMKDQDLGVMVLMGNFRVQVRIVLHKLQGNFSRLRVMQR